MKQKFVIFLLFVIGIFLSGLTLSGKFLTIEKRFGKNNLYTPENIVVSNNKIFILDDIGSSSYGDEKIKIFSEDGKFLHQFGEKGEGPGSFIQAAFIIILNKKLYLLDNFGLKIQVFSEEIPNKHLKTIRLGSTNVMFSSPHDFLILSNGTIYLNSCMGLKGDMIIKKMLPHDEKQFKVEKQFLDCIPLYDDMKDFNKQANKAQTPEITRNRFLNVGRMAENNKKIYYVSYLLNTVFEMSLDGDLLNKYTLPIKSIDKTVSVIKIRDSLNIERRLNYGIIGRNGRLYVLSRDEAGNSIVFELLNGKFSEKCRVKEPLFNFDISGNKLYGITQEDENVEPEILIYRLDK